MSVRLAIFATHPIQYHVPLWRHLAELPEFEVQVYYGCNISVRGYRDREFGVEVAWDTPLLEGYKSCFLSTDPAIERISLVRPKASGIPAYLADFSPDVGLITGYWNVFHLGCWRELRKRRTAVLIRHEASDVAHGRSGVKARLRDWLLRRFYRRIDGFCYIGTEARSHLKRFGLPDSKMWYSPYCVDSDFVSKQIAEWSPRRQSLRAECGMGGDDVVVVFSGKLIAKKDPLLLVEALEAIKSRKDGPDSVIERVHVLVAGDGELRDTFAEALRAVLGPRARMLGFLNQRELGRAYAMGDLLCLPSRKGTGETWGLVANEALQWGLPCLLSDGVGSSVDLIREGVTGWRFSSGSSKELADCLVRFLGLRSSERERMAKSAREMAEAHSLNVARDGIREACRALAPRGLGAETPE